MNRLKRWLDVLLWESSTDGQDIYRMKGLFTKPDGGICVLQSVHELYDLTDVRTAGIEQANRLVIIGRRLDREQLLGCFTACVQSRL